MTYDYYGSFSNGGHLSGLYQNPQQKSAVTGFTCDASIKSALQICPSTKLCSGVPFYARGWTKPTPDPANPSAPIIFGINSGQPCITYSNNTGGEPGLSCWKDMRDVIANHTNGLTETYDLVAQVPDCNNPSTGETWTYDNPSSVGTKAQYIIDNKLAGAICWQLSDDVRDGKNSLLECISK